MSDPAQTGRFYSGLLAVAGHLAIAAPQIFTAADDAGRTEFRYAGRDGFLAEKVRIEDRRVRWKVEYRDYRRGADGWIPAGIVIHNRRYGYRLVAKAKDLEAK